MFHTSLLDVPDHPVVWLYLSLLSSLYRAWTLRVPLKAIHLFGYASRWKCGCCNKIRTVTADKTKEINSIKQNIAGSWRYLVLRNLQPGGWERMNKRFFATIICTRKTTTRERGQEFSGNSKFCFSRILQMLMESVSWSDTYVGFFKRLYASLFL